ncbi:TspO/MBR family protein [Caenispirillum salinarum]|uniref:TspO/MBR family protein n=1 Tax=Caenispirillum salinarum TaxID=859058 RepID=UPI00384BAB1C
MTSDAGRPGETRQRAAHRGRAALVGLAAFLGAVFIAMLIAGLATRVGVNGWYAEASKPFWTPPDWVFTPVWTALYALMAVAAWLVWRRSGWHGARLALTLFFVQLGLNVLWPILFFSFKLTGWASLEILLLVLAILATAWRFDRHSRIAAALLLPYAVWTGYAASISIAVWLMMPGAEAAGGAPPA